MKNSILVFALLILISCDSDPRGVAHRSINDTYENLTFGKKVYSESLLRAVSQVSEIDSNYLISSNTEYLLDWSIDTTARWYVDGTDSIIVHALETAGMEKYASYRSNKAEYALYVASDAEIITDLVVVQLDTTKLQVYEFVGDMPLDKLLEFGLTNYEDFNQALNFNFLVNAGRDTTD